MLTHGHGRRTLPHANLLAGLFRPQRARTAGSSPMRPTRTLDRSRRAVIGIESGNYASGPISHCLVTFFGVRAAVLHATPLDPYPKRGNQSLTIAAAQPNPLSPARVAVAISVAPETRTGSRASASDNDNSVASATGGRGAGAGRPYGNGKEDRMSKHTSFAHERRQAAGNGLIGRLALGVSPAPMTRRAPDS